MESDILPYTWHLQTFENSEGILETTEFVEVFKDKDKLLENATNIIEKDTENELGKLPMLDGAALTVSELLKRGYKVRGISVQLVKKLEIFKRSNVSLIKFVKTKNGIKMYFAYTPKDEAKGKYIFVNTATKLVQPKPLKLKISLKREKGDKK